jgi:hypothetical protein
VQAIAARIRLAFLRSRESPNGRDTHRIASIANSASRITLGGRLKVTLMTLHDAAHAVGMAWVCDPLAVRSGY